MLGVDSFQGIYHNLRGHEAISHRSNIVELLFELSFDTLQVLGNDELESSQVLNGEGLIKIVLTINGNDFLLIIHIKELKSCWELLITESLLALLNQLLVISDELNSLGFTV